MVVNWYLGVLRVALCFAWVLRLHPNNHKLDHIIYTRHLDEPLSRWG